MTLVISTYHQWLRNRGRDCVAAMVGSDFIFIRFPPAAVSELDRSQGRRKMARRSAALADRSVLIAIGGLGTTIIVAISTIALIAAIDRIHALT